MNKNGCPHLFHFMKCFFCLFFVLFNAVFFILLSHFLKSVLWKRFLCFAPLSHHKKMNETCLKRVMSYGTCFHLLTSKLKTPKRILKSPNGTFQSIRRDYRGSIVMYFQWILKYSKGTMGTSCCTCTAATTDAAALFGINWFFSRSSMEYYITLQPYLPWKALWQRMI